MDNEPFLEVSENEIQRLLLAVVTGIADDDERAELFSLALTDADLRKQIALSLPSPTEDDDIQEAINH